MSQIDIEKLRDKAINDTEKIGDAPFNQGGITSNVVTSPEVLYPKIITSLLYIVGMVAVLALLYGGFLYITAGGEAEKAEKGKKVIIGSVIGLALIASAFVIYNTIIQGLQTGRV